MTDLRRFDHRDGDPGPAAAPLDDDQHSGRELPAEGPPQGRAGATARTRRGGGRGSFLGLGLRPRPRRPIHEVQGWGIFDRYNGEFSTGIDKWNGTVSGRDSEDEFDNSGGNCGNEGGGKVRPRKITAHRGVKEKAWPAKNNS